MEIFYQLFNFSSSATWLGVVTTLLISLMPFSIMGFLFAKHRKEEPPYLITFDRMKGLKNAWTLFLVLTAPLVFIYNVFVWTGYAFVVFAQFISYILISIFVLVNILVNERFSGYEIYFICIILLTSLILKNNIKLRLDLLSKIGLISFSWYLLHNAIGIIIIRELNKLGVENFSVIIAILLTLSLSVFSFKFVETPMKRSIVNMYKIYFKNKSF